MPLDTHESAKPSGVVVPLLHYQTFSISFKLGYSSGIGELIDAQFYGSFHLGKVTTSRPKNFAQFCQVRWQR